MIKLLGRGRYRVVCIVGILVVAIGLAGCDVDNEPATAAPTATIPLLVASPSALMNTESFDATPSPDADRLAVTEDGYLVGDGICDARVPLGWIEDAPGTGTTSDGHAFSVFGNQLTGPDAWTTAATLLRDQANRQPDAVLSQSDQSVRITYANGAGLAYRVRFANVYCDLRITGRGETVTDRERATWEVIIASLQPSN